jgi:CRISPR-associated protein Cas6
VLKLPINKIGNYLKLAGKTLDVMGQKLTIGVPKTKALIPAVALFAQLVTTKNGHDQSRFEAEIKSQMEKMDVHGNLTVEKRRTFQVHGKQVVGYSILATELTAVESIALQENGLGGRQKMGCGFFEVREG